MKLWTSLTLILLFQSCSSLKEEKVVNDGLSKDALSFYYSAEEYRLRGNYKEAINLYDRAGSLYISKLSYREYVLTQLKKALTLITLEENKSAKKILTRARFWEKSFQLDLDSEIKAVEAKLLLAYGKNQEAYDVLQSLIILNKDNLLLKTYYQSLSLETGLQVAQALLPEISQSFQKLFSQYSDKGTLNPDALIYIGKILMKSQSDDQLTKQMELISRELEIPALSLFILEYYLKHASKENKAFYRYLIDEIKRKEKAGILI